MVALIMLIQIGKQFITTLFWVDFFLAKNERVCQTESDVENNPFRKLIKLYWHRVFFLNILILIHSINVFLIEIPFDSFDDFFLLSFESLVIELLCVRWKCIIFLVKQFRLCIINQNKTLSNCNFFNAHGTRFVISLWLSYN